MSHIMTVLGPVAADTLGIVLPHEHLLCDMRRVTGNFDHLVDDAMLAIKEVKQFKDAGGTSVVDVTSWGLGAGSAYTPAYFTRDRTAYCDGAVAGIGNPSLTVRCTRAP